MPRQITWDTSEAWLTWLDSAGSSIRTVDGWLKCPYNPVSHLGTGSAASEVTARYRFGQYYGNPDAYNNQQGSAPDLLKPPGALAENTEYGLICINRNGRLQNSSTTNDNFNRPLLDGIWQGGYVSCWIKSNRTEYSTRAYVVVYHKGIGDEDIYFAIVIDPPGLIKGVISYTGTGEYIATPIGGDVSIESGDWHHVLFLLTPPCWIIVDNVWVDDLATSPSIINSADDQIFNIGGTAFDDALGFDGYIDEVTFGRCTPNNPGNLAFDDWLPSYRFSKSILLSPVVDTEENNSLLSSILVKFNQPNGSYLQFGFRASDTAFVATDAFPEWSGFTSPNQIVSETMADISSLGTYIRGRYHQIRVMFNPSNDSSPIPDTLGLDAPSIQSLALTTARENNLLNPATPAYVPGTILAQIVNFEGTKTIDKVTLDLVVNPAGRKTIIEGKGQSISFQAANFQSGRDVWTFQPVIPWATGFTSSGTPITNSLQSTIYTDASIAVSYAPSLAYRVYFPEGGAYDLWGYGYTQGDGLFWGLDEDPSDLHRCVLGSELSGWSGVPRWSKFGTIYLEEGGVHTFTVYLSSLDYVLLDQWYFTKNHNLESDLEAIGSSAFGTPLPLSECPFVTAVRLRSLNNGELDSLSSPLPESVSITSWQTSQNMVANGKFNFEIRDNSTASGVVFTDGLSIEFWQIGGNQNNFAAWAYVFPDDGSGVGTTKISIDYGQTFE